MFYPTKTTAASDLYSTLEDDLDTVGCFLDFHEISESPRNKQNLEMYLLVFEHDAHLNRKILADE